MENLSAELSAISFEELSERAYVYLIAQQEICENHFKIGTHENWYYDQETGLLTFSTNGVVQVVIEYEEVGSVSLETNTWLWAWANPHLEEKIKSEIAKVRDYGISRNFEKLLNKKWPAQEVDGWEMTAIASYILQTKGAYRVPRSDKRLFSFMIFKSIRFAEEGK